MTKPYIRIAYCIILMFLAGSTLLPAAEQPPALRRFAFLIGADNGGRDRVKLAYTTTDTRSMAEVLLEMGGLDESDLIILSNPRVDDVKEAFSSLKTKLSSSGSVARRREFIFYYSGHSDETGLLLKGENLPYKDLKDSIQAVHADVHIAILDSCSSGAFTRLKGGLRRSPFMMDESVDTRGHAFLTSSSEDEAAQESDMIQASFFTYFLVAALRGAADSTMDGKVTLNEAYSYAAEETLARTEKTLAGAQHASYDIQLAGSGDLVLTDLRTASARLEISGDLAGRLYIRDDHDRLVAELRKLQGVPLSFGVPAGTYRVGLEGNDGLQEAVLTVGDGRMAFLSSGDFSTLRPERTRSRGDEEPELIHVYSSISLVPDFTANPEYRLVHHMSAGIINMSYRIEGFQAGILNFVTEDVRGFQAAGVFNISGENIAGGQGAGVFNINGGDASFLQGAGVFNINDGSLKGFQGAGVFNIVGGDMSGVQGAGVFNITDGSMLGAQLSGIFNIADKKMSGLQAGGIFNIAGNDDASGVQLSGIFNAAEDFRGVQGSLVNVAEDLRGVQLGLVNIGEDVRGIQAGLVNISRDIRGIPIGLINISGTGLHHLQGWYDEFGYAYGGIQAGTRNLYTIAYAGVPYAAPDSALAAGAGVGIHLRLGNLYAEGDVSARRIVQGASLEENVRSIFITSTAGNVFPAARAMVGFKIFDFLAVFGGFSLNGCIRDVTDPEMFVFEGTPWKALAHGDIPWTVDLYPSWTVGIRI